jgi:hypothetical protein
MTLYSNYWSQENEDAVRADLMEENHGEPVTDEEVINVMAVNDEDDWTFFSEDLESFMEENAPFIVTGYFGTWRGALSGGKICYTFKDCVYLEFRDDKGHFNMRGSHHDGTNIMEMRKLTIQGCALAEKEKSEENYDKVFSCNLFSTLPHFARTVYGSEGK